MKQSSLASQTRRKAIMLRKFLKLASFPGSTPQLFIALSWGVELG